jgi:hypothetical protein
MQSTCYACHILFKPEFSKNPQISKFMKICPVRVRLFHTDRWRDITKLILAFVNSENMLKKETTFGSQVCSSPRWKEEIQFHSVLLFKYKIIDKVHQPSNPQQRIITSDCYQIHYMIM